MISTPDIYELEDALHSANATMGASEAHGALCAILCVRGSADMSEWVGHVLGEQQGGDAMRQSLDLLNALYQVTMNQMNGNDFGFQLYLPDDDEDLRQRVDALTAWCQGFVYGLAVGGITDETDLPEDSAELIRDIIEISRADAEDGAPVTEEDEVAYAEIVEYLRTGTLLINEELSPLATSMTLH